MSDRFDYGPLQTYEIIWKSGHVERIQAHQVTWPQNGMVMARGILGTMTEVTGDGRIDFHGEIEGKWRLVLSALEDDIRTVRLVTADEPIPNGAS